MEKLVNKENPDLGVWPSMAEMHRGLAEFCEKTPVYRRFEAKYVTVQAWFRYGRVSYVWHDIIKGAAAARGWNLTDEEMAVICPR